MRPLPTVYSSIFIVGDVLEIVFYYVHGLFLTLRRLVAACDCAGIYFLTLQNDLALTRYYLFWAIMMGYLYPQINLKILK